MSEREPKLIENPSPTLIHNLYLSAPHSKHLDPKYFPWCEECNPQDAA